MKYLLHIITVSATIILLAGVSVAQDSLVNSYTDISKIKFQQTITKTISSVYIPKNEKAETGYASLPFITGLQHRGFIPNNFINKKILIKFNVYNSSDTVTTVYFFPGFYFDQIELYTIEKKGIKKLPIVIIWWFPRSHGLAV